jgi:hypothetical protein
MDPLIATYFSSENEPGSGTSTTAGSAEVMEYFTPLKENIAPERCARLVSRSGQRARVLRVARKYSRVAVIT